jgi:hypothetical protein
MDSVVIKYLVWALFAYGLQALFAIAQILLSIYLIAGGVLQLSSKEGLGKWSGRLGLVIHLQSQKAPWLGWMMIVVGGGLILPFLTGATYWVSAVASSMAFVLLLYLARPLAVQGIRTGRFARSSLVFCAGLIFCLTLWEGGDLIGMAKTVVTKAKYWRDKEVAGWQTEHNPNVPKIGDMAPDFQLSDQTGEKTVRLSDFRGKKPVVLVFGSFT